jgi:hypothetical protein
MKSAYEDIGFKPLDNIVDSFMRAAADEDLSVIVPDQQIVLMLKCIRYESAVL